MRARTLRPSSSFLICSLALSGLRWPSGPLALAAVAAHLAAGRGGVRAVCGVAAMVVRPSGRLGAGAAWTDPVTVRAHGRPRRLRASRGRSGSRASASDGRRWRATWRCCDCQPAGQMALDMRPRSTWRRLTKAIPARDMTEAWHGDLGPVHHCPRCGPHRLALRDDVVPLSPAVDRRWTGKSNAAPGQDLGATGRHRPARWSAADRRGRSVPGTVRHGDGAHGGRAIMWRRKGRRRSAAYPGGRRACRVTSGPAPDGGHPTGSQTARPGPACAPRGPWSAGAGPPGARVRPPGPPLRSLNRYGRWARTRPGSGGPATSRRAPSPCRARRRRTGSPAARPRRSGSRRCAAST